MKASYFRGSVVGSYLVVASIFLAGILAQANSKNSFQKTQIHGFDVYLVNVPGATEAYFTAVVPSGSSFDDPVVHAGRAHLWEHVIHRGNQKFPNGALNDGSLDAIAAKYNASTGGNQVFYYASIPSKNLEKLIEILGAQITTPLISESDFLSEREVVKNEAKSYQNQDGRALTSTMNIYLQEKGHPLSMYSVGTQDQLDAMTTQDMKDIFYRDYRPGNLFLIVAGDFQSQIHQESVLSSIEKFFVPPQVPSSFSGLTPSSKKIFPVPTFPLKKTDIPPQVIELESKEGHRILQMTFDANSSFFRQHPEAKAVLLSYLRSGNTGSLEKILKDMHWIQEWGVSEVILNNRHLFEFEMILTEEGFLHRHDLIDRILVQGGELSRKHLSQELIDYLRVQRAQKLSLQTNGNANAAARILQEQLIARISPEKTSNLFLFTENYEKVSAEDIRQAAQHLFLAPHRMIGLVAPEVNKMQGLAIDPIFGRKYKILQDPELQERWELALQSRTWNGQNITLDFKLGKVPGVVRIKNKSLELTLHESSKVPTGLLSEEVTYKKDRAFIERAKKEGQDSFALSFNLRTLSAQESLALSIGISAFINQNLDYFDYFSYAGLSLDPQIRLNGLVISTQGDTQSVLAATKWFLQSWKNFQPTSQELLVALEEARSEEIQSSGQFSAYVAYLKVNSILYKNDRDSLKVLSFLKKKELENPGYLQKMIEKIFLRTDIYGGFAGTWSKDMVFDLLQTARQYWPENLTPQELKNLQNSTLPLQKTTELHSVLPGNRDLEEFSQARLWHLKEINVLTSPKDSNSSRLLEKILSTMAFQINRTDKGLGYVHGASRLTPNMSPYIMLYGQTSLSQERSLSIANGWIEIFEKIKNGDPYARQVFEDSKKGLLHELEQIPSVGGQAYTLENLVKNNISKNFRAEIIQQLPEVQYEDIVHLVETYMSPDHPYLDVKMHEKISQSTAKRSESSSSEGINEAPACTNIFFNVKSARRWMQGKE